MESDDFTRHYIIRYLSARELVLPPLGPACQQRPRDVTLDWMRNDRVDLAKKGRLGVLQPSVLCALDLFP